jgi:hypothetical protein
MLKKLAAITLLSALFICGCSTYIPLKAPCDQNGIGCGIKQKINQ